MYIVCALKDTKTHLFAFMFDLKSLEARVLTIKSQIQLETEKKQITKHCPS